MAFDKLRLAASVITFIVPYGFVLIGRSLSAFFHRFTYKSLPPSETKNVVVIGGSFAGVQIAKRLADTLPTGYRVILIEKNSHFNYVFLFPRFSVVKGHEQFAFIPYDGIAKSAPKGIFEFVQDTAKEVSDKHILLGSGEKIDYEYLIVTTGTSSAIPSKLISTERDGAMGELQITQNKIEDAKRIAVIGGGAVGVELASDIKSFYPDKEVALIHSRGQLLPTFGKKLHDETMKAFEALGVSVLLNERPKIPADGHTLTLLNGKVEEFDLVIPCTGQRPNSSIVSTLSPESISEQSSHILVKPTLQISDDAHPNIFAFGDVAATGGPKMARAAHFQCEIVLHNVLASIAGRKTLQDYKPKMSFEGSIKLTLGKDRICFYIPEDEILVPMKYNKVDLGVKTQWKFYGADVKKVEQESKQSKA